MTDHWRTGDGVDLRPHVPQKADARWKKAFDAGAVAVLIALHDLAARKPVHGATVYLLADHNFDEALAVARQRFLPQTKRGGGGDE